MPRSLTDREQSVLAHVVVTPVSWFAHAVAWPKIDAEHAIAAKVSQWASEYDAEKLRLGNAYKTRAVRQAEEDEERG